MDSPQELADEVVVLYREGNMEAYYVKLDELKFSCNEECDWKHCLREAGMPAAMMERSADQLKSGDVCAARDTFGRAQRFFGSCVQQLDGHYNLSPQLELASAA